jgi:CheY-like chemotaxis protein
MTGTRHAITAPKSSAAKSRLRRNGLRYASDHLETSSFVQTLQAPEEQGFSNVLLIDEAADHAQNLTRCLEGMGLHVEPCPKLRDALNRLQMLAGRYDLVLVVISNPSRPWDLILHDLQEATHQSRHQRRPFFLCVTKTRTLLQLRLTIEQMGARLAYER